MSDVFKESFKIGSADSGTSIPPNSGQGGSTDDFDARYLRQSLNLSDLDSVSTALGNIGLGVADTPNFTGLELGVENTTTGTILFESEDSGLPRLRMRGYGLADDAAIFTESSSDQLLELINTGAGVLNVDIDGDLDVGGDVTGADGLFSGDMQADTLRPESGKFLSPVSYQFRNVGDNAFRNVEIAGLTATTGEFSNNLDFQDNLRAGTTTVIDSSRNLFANQGEFEGRVTIASNGNIPLYIDGQDWVLQSRPAIYLDSDGRGTDWQLQGSETNASGLRWRAIYDGNPAEDVFFIEREGDVTVTRDTFVGRDLEVDGDGLFHSDIELDGSVGDGNIGTDNFVSRVSGWRGTYSGDWDVRSLFSDSIVTKAFTADVAQAFRGSRFLSKSFASIKESFTVPAVSSSTTVTVAEVEGFTGLEVFEQNDFVLVQILNMEYDGDGLLTGEVWGEITSTITDNGDGTQSFTFTTRDVSVAELVGETAQVGNEMLSFGSAASPVGFIHDTVLDSQGSPYSQVITWTTNPWNRSNWNVRLRSGILDGITGLSGAGVYTERFFGTESILIGDLDEVDNFIKYESGVFSANLSELDIDIDSANRIFADASGIDIRAEEFLLDAGTLWMSSDAGRLNLGTDAANITVGGDEPGIAMHFFGHMKAFIDADNYIRANASGVDIRTESLYVDAGGLLFDSDNELIEVGTAHYLDGANNEVSFSNGIFTADNTEIGLAAFTVDSETLFTSNIFIGNDLNANHGTDAKEEYIAIGERVAGQKRVDVVGTGGVDVSRVMMFHSSSSSYGFIATADSVIRARFGSENFIQGLEVGSDGIFGDNWLIDNDVWIHPSLGGKIITRESNAAFDISTNDADDFSSEWGTRASASGSGDDNANRTVKRVRWTKPFGMNQIIISGKGKRNETISGGLWTRTSRVHGRIKGEAATEDFKNFTGSTHDEFKLNLDVSGLTAGIDYEIQLEIEAIVDGDAGNSIGDTAELTTLLREDLDIDEATEEV